MIHFNNTDGLFIFCRYETHTSFVIPRFININFIFHEIKVFPGQTYHLSKPQS